MMTDKFKRGDIVMLKSGGPLMCVDRTSNGSVHLCYFVRGASGLMTCELHEDMLTDVAGELTTAANQIRDAIMSAGCQHDGDLH